MLFIFVCIEEITLLVAIDPLIMRRRTNEKKIVECVARTQGSYTFWVATLNNCLKEW